MLSLMFIMGPHVIFPTEIPGANVFLEIKIMARSKHDRISSMDLLLEKPLPYRKNDSSAIP